MILKKGKQKMVKKLVPVGVTPDIIGCDQCRSVINMGYGVEFTVFKKEGKHEKYECCSWRCAFVLLRMVECDYFISLPMIHYDIKPPKGDKGTAQEFLRIIKQFHG